MSQIPGGVRALAAFFAFGACMSFLACVGLLFPGGALEPMWQLNRHAHDAFLQMGPGAIGLMGAVGVACALSARGLLTHALWGYWLVLAVLTVNLIGDAANAIIRDDFRTLVGLPIGGALIAYVLRPKIRRLFGRRRRNLARPEVVRSIRHARRHTMQMPPILESVLTCPHCGHASVEVMPTDACIFFHECSSCRALLRPKAGDCCVFCSYGSVKCPTMQQSQGCCADGTIPEEKGHVRSC